jgi:hypothetical protein
MSEISSKLVDRTGEPKGDSSSSELLGEIGLEALLRYVSNPTEYIRTHRDVKECSDAQRSDWDAWARSRAGLIHRKLFT